MGTEESHPLNRLNRRDTILYWVFTILIMAPNFLTAFSEVFTPGPAAVIHTLHVLGYPLYLMKILGFAKILGPIAIISGYSPRLKEWAYAGFTFEFLGAAASHAFAGDITHIVTAIVFLALLMGSYFYWNKTKASTLLTSNASPATL